MMPSYRYRLLLGCWILWLTLWSAAPTSETAPTKRSNTNANDNDNDEALLTEMVAWIKVSGGWISDKVEIQQVRPGLSTVVTNEPLEKGEVVVTIPWDTILKATVDDDTDWCDQVEEVRRVITKAPELQTPYERYLARRSRGHIPLFWSQSSKDLLSQIMDGFVIHGFETDIEEAWENHCEAPIDDGYMDAMMLLQTRGEGEDIDLLVPFGDLLNHRNGNYTNVDPEIDYGNHYQIVATRDVEAGEQLQNSYNRCKWCDGLYDNADRPDDYYVTPQLFEVYGFLEPWPQRWILPEARLLFDIIEEQERDNLGRHSLDGLQVNFVAPPSHDGVDYLKERLGALSDFEREFRNSTGIPRQEYEGIFSLHGAMSRAFSLALEQSVGRLSNSAWHMGDAWHRGQRHSSATSSDEL